MIICNSKPLAIISYDTYTCAILKKIIARESSLAITRIHPDEFFSNPLEQYQYINLVIKDWDERVRISTRLSELNFDRWTYIGESTVVDFFNASELTVGAGCVIFPSVWAYFGVIGDDVIVHGNVRLAENVKIGNGCYISGNVSLAGSCSVGNRCYIGNNLFFLDNVHVCDDVRLLPGTNLRKSIVKPGNYYNPGMFDIGSIIL